MKPNGQPPIQLPESQSSYNRVHRGVGIQIPRPGLEQKLEDRQAENRCDQYHRLLVRLLGFGSKQRPCRKQSRKNQCDPDRLFERQEVLVILALGLDDAAHPGRDLVMGPFGLMLEEIPFIVPAKSAVIVVDDLFPTQMPEQPVRAVGLEADLSLFQIGLVPGFVGPEIPGVVVIFGPVHPVAVGFVVEAHHQVMGHADGLAGVDFKMQGRLHRLGVQQHPQGKAPGRKAQAQRDAPQLFKTPTVKQRTQFHEHHGDEHNHRLGLDAVPGEGGKAQKRPPDNFCPGFCRLARHLIAANRHQRKDNARGIGISHDDPWGQPREQQGG